MKKKLLEKDGFYLALFACVCLVAVGGIWFTNKNVNNLASNKEILNENDKNDKDEINLIKKDDSTAVPTSTESEETLKNAKEKAQQKDKESQIESKLGYIGKEVIRGYSETEPSYSKTLDVWEIHKGLDVSADNGQAVKSLTTGKITDVYNDDEYSMVVKVSSEDGTVVTYSNLDKNVKVKKDQKINEGDQIGFVGNDSKIESQDGPHIHLEASKEGKSVDPMSLIK